MVVEDVQCRVDSTYNLNSGNICIYPAFQRTMANGGLKNNKSCPTYLGCYIAEKVLYNVFKNVVMMPPNNTGYDFICNGGKKIDVKSATIKKCQKAWDFRINKNDIADYFLCLAFDNRTDLNPLHLWLIPGHVVNNLVSLTISASTIYKWKEHELLDKLYESIEHCNVKRVRDDAKAYMLSRQMYSMLKGDANGR